MKTEELRDKTFVFLGGAVVAGTELVLETGYEPGVLKFQIGTRTLNGGRAATKELAG